MEYEWDDEKNAENIKKHHISFEDAVMVFADPYRIERYDQSTHNNSGEDRWQTIGQIGRVIFVCYTERRDAVRMISARLATPEERRIYNGSGEKKGSDWTRAY